MALAPALSALERFETLRARKDVFARHYQVDRLLRQMLAEEGRPFARALVADLFASWGDPLNEAGESYIGSCLAHAQATTGHVLQCGSGLMTLLLGIACARSAGHRRHLWCLTDDRHGANVTRSWLTQYNIANAHVVVSQPRIFDGFVWYNIDPAKLPEGFSLALCEGGSAAVSGAVGLSERIGSRLSKDCVILARHVTMGKDQAGLQHWAKARAMHCTVVDKTNGFLKVTKPA